MQSNLKQIIYIQKCDIVIYANLTFVFPSMEKCTFYIPFSNSVFSLIYTHLIIIIINTYYQRMQGAGKEGGEKRKRNKT